MRSRRKGQELRRVKRKKRKERRLEITGKGKDRAEG